MIPAHQITEIDAIPSRPSEIRIAAIRMESGQRWIELRLFVANREGAGMNGTAKALRVHPLDAERIIAGIRRAAAECADPARHGNPNPSADAGR